MSLRERMERKSSRETRRVSREEALAAFYRDIDPMHYAGERFTATDEIARPKDVRRNPWLYARVMNEEDYWPTVRKGNRK
jgi:hypothetical protein